MTPELYQPERTARGFTVIELMMALTVFAIGVTGIAAMQKVTVTANSHAKTLALATHIAESWEEQLAADSTLWANAAADSSSTRWLAEGEWTRPANMPASGTATFGASFDPLGNFTTNEDEVFFCTHIRLTRLSAGPELPGNGLYRAEVRVFWPRAGRQLSNPTYCDEDTDANSFTVDDTDDFHFVHVVSAVRQNPL